MLPNFFDMQYFHAGVGLFLIASGFLVKKYPILIAGYNTMTEEQQKNVDIDGLSTLMRNGFIVMGVLVATLPFIFNLLGWKSLVDSSIPIGILGVLPVILIKAQNYDHNASASKKKVFVIVSILVGVGLFVAVLITTGVKPPQVELNDRFISISGMYGIHERVMEMELLPTIPKITKKTNGFNYGEVLKGNFNLEELGSCKLFLQSDRGPYIFIRSTTEIPIIINKEHPADTKALYEKLKIGLE